MIKPINDFVGRFGTAIRLNETLIVKTHSRYFLLNENLKQYAGINFFYAGTYLGKVKEGKFFPSFGLLDIIAKTKANRIFIDKKTEWLFICGRDIFKRGITKVAGSTKKNNYTLVVNSQEECLGFGRILHNLGRERIGPIVENILDAGDFLRREK